MPRRTQSPGRCTPFQMRLAPFILLTLISLSVNSQSLRQQLLRQDTTLKDVEIIKCKIDPTLFIALLVTEYNWWESISIVKFQKGQILWTARFDTLPSSQSILSARQISLKGIPNPLIEVFDETHMGNGFYYLYELRGKTIRLLASTRAVDNNDDGEIEIIHKSYSRLFKGGQLKPTYIDINKDGHTDIKLTGTIQIVGDKYLKEYFAQKILLYDKANKRFVEEVRQRKGFKPTDD